MKQSEADLISKEIERLKSIQYTDNPPLPSFPEFIQGEINQLLKELLRIH